MKQETLQLTGGGKKENRRALDFYPTPHEVTTALMEFLHKSHILDKHSIIWEPACGDGAMARIIESFHHRVISSDIAQECDINGKQFPAGNSGTDFLLTNNEDYKDVHAIITNPPFNLSEAFIVKALSIAPIVAMVLKSQYWHAKKRLPVFTANPPAYVLPLTWRPDFLNGEKGGAPTMEVMWTVWVKGDNLTKYIPLTKPNYGSPS